MKHLYSSGFLRVDTLDFDAEPGAITLAGEMGCLGNIVISVFKRILVVDAETLGGRDVLVRTHRYAYNASVRGADSFLRHDNAHVHLGHPDSHHRHEFDWKTGNEFHGFPKWVGTQGWPLLGDFVQEVADWYWHHRHELPSPEAVPILGLRRSIVDSEGE